MPMQLKPVTNALAQVGLKEPPLQALAPDHNNYDVLLLQPPGDIYADEAGVRNWDAATADKQFGQFLVEARKTRAALVITPEYSMPWRTLTESIKNGTVPEYTKLWVLGCESMKYSDLVQLKQDLAPYAEVLFEELEPAEDRFVDPLAYVFQATLTGDTDTRKLVVLVQFKTYPMSDPDHFEQNHLLCGTYIYQFGGEVTAIRLVSIICSDALDVEDDLVAKINDRTLIIHVQLNPDPRHPLFRQYRDRLFRLAGDCREVISLNWARNLQVRIGETPTPWNNIGGSAWYLRSDSLDLNDQALIANHRRGLYYTWLKSNHAHALFFNYEPAAYLVSASKVVQLNVVAVHGQRTGPALQRRRIWDQANDIWIDEDAAPDGFAEEAPASGASSNALIEMVQNNPFATERMLALSAGEVTGDARWHHVQWLDSCTIDTSEFIHRMTFCQDPAGHNFRISRLRRYRFLWDHLQSKAALPPALQALQGNFQLTWSNSSPHQNLLSANGEKATVIYVGEEKDSAQVEEIANRLSALLDASFRDADSRLTAKQRLFVWYRSEDGSFALHNTYPYLDFDRTDGESPVDIGRDR